MGKSETIEQFLESRKIRDLIELDFQFSDRGLMYYGAERLSEKLQKINGEEEIKPIGQNAIALHYIKVLERLLEQMRRSGKRCVAVLRNIEALDKASADILASCFLAKRRRLYGSSASTARALRRSRPWWSVYARSPQHAGSTSRCSAARRAKNIFMIKSPLTIGKTR